MTIAELYTARYNDDTSTDAYLTDGRQIIDISRNDDGSYYLWTNAGELTVTAERMVITRSAPAAAAAPAFVKTITPETDRSSARPVTEYRAELDGQLIGYYKSYSQAEIALDTLVCELLAGDLTRTATELDGSSSDEEIAADMAEHGPCANVNWNSAPRRSPAVVHEIAAEYRYLGTRYDRIRVGGTLTLTHYHVYGPISRQSHQANVFIPVEHAADAADWSKAQDQYGYRLDAAVPFSQMIELAVAGPDAEPPVDDGPADNWGTFRTPALSVSIGS